MGEKKTGELDPKTKKSVDALIAQSKKQDTETKASLTKLLQGKIPEEVKKAMQELMKAAEQQKKYAEILQKAIDAANKEKGK